MRARRHVDGFFSRTFGRVFRYRELAIQKKGRPLPDALKDFSDCSGTQRVQFKYRLTAVKLTIAQTVKSNASSVQTDIRSASAARIAR